MSKGFLLLFDFQKRNCQRDHQRNWQLWWGENSLLQDSKQTVHLVLGSVVEIEIKIGIGNRICRKAGAILLL